jgi:hypothetical protein
MTCHFYAQKPSLFSCFNKIIPQTACLLLNACNETQQQNALLTRNSTFFMFFTTSFLSSCAVCRDGLADSYNSSFFKCPTLPVVPSCNLSDGQGIFLYSYAPTINKEFAQCHRVIHNDKRVQNSQQYNIILYRTSRPHISN